MPREIDLRTATQKNDSAVPPFKGLKSFSRSGSSTLFRSQSSIQMMRSNTPKPFNSMSSSLSMMDAEKENAVREKMSDHVYSEHEERMMDTEDGKEMGSEFREWLNAMVQVSPNLSGFSVDPVEIRNATVKLRISSVATNSKKTSLNCKQVSAMLKNKNIIVNSTSPMLFCFNGVSDRDFERFGFVLRDILSGVVSPPRIGSLEKRQADNRADNRVQPRISYVAAHPNGAFRVK
eukprot:GHVH01011485.1.p1 GENE.GHVH01011485.1~~GHVH01011485.1.p1  ORF type:complete len:234 (+),score=35.83 GHVH01011485.1:98-799(+)